MKQTYIICSPSERDNFRKEAKRYIQINADEFRGYMKYGRDAEDIDHDKGETFVKKAEQFFYDHGSFYEQGLELAYNKPEGNKRGYLRYLLTFGGPSFEIRFYADGGQTQPDKIEAVYMNWGTGIGYDVTDQDWAKWLWDEFYETSFEYLKEKAYSEQD